MKAIRLLAGFGVLVAFSACKTPEVALQAEGKFVRKDCLGVDESSRSVPAFAVVQSNRTILGKGSKRSFIFVKATADGGVTRSDLEKAAKKPKAFKLTSETDSQVAGKVTEILTFVEKFDQVSDVARCEAGSYQVAVLRTDCPAEVASAQPCSSRLEINIYSKADPLNAGEPLSTFQSARVKHPRDQKPFVVSELTVVE